MQSSQHLKCCFLAFGICTLVTFIAAISSGVTVPTALASSRQETFITDPTQSLAASPSQLNEKVCHSSNHQNWTCVVTLYGQNIGNTIAWSAYTPNSSISINPHKGYLAQVASIVQVAISHIPCMNTYFLFSGQELGGGGVIPITIPWSCKKKPTSTPIPVPQPSPTPKIKVLTPTPVATGIPRPTPTMTTLPTSVISSSSQNNPPVQGNENSSTNMFIVSASIFLMLEIIVALVLIAVLIRRRIFRRL